MFTTTLSQFGSKSDKRFGSLRMDVNIYNRIQGTEVTGTL